MEMISLVHFNVQYENKVRISARIHILVWCLELLDNPAMQIVRVDYEEEAAGMSRVKILHQLVIGSCKLFIENTSDFPLSDFPQFTIVSEEL